MSTPCILAAVAIVLLLPIIIILWATESTEQRVRRLRTYGYSQRKIAEQLQVSRYRVRLALA
jgi:broad-specificity NMP kinase